MAEQTRKTRCKRIQNSDPGKILDLVMSLTDDTCNAIQMKINTYLSDECEADLVFQVIVHGDRKEAFIEAIGKSPLPRKMKIKLTDKLVETLRSRMDKTELFSNFEQDFQDIVKHYIPADSTKVRRVVMMPLESKPFSVIFCIIGARVSESQVPIFIEECSQFIWPTLKKAIAYENEWVMKIKCQHLLRIAKRLCTQVASIETLLRIMIDQAKNLLKAEYCVIMLVDADKMEFYDACPPPKSAGKDYLTRRFDLNKGICGQVIQTGAFVNAKIATEHPAFNLRIDSLPDVKCKNLLCFPIREQSGIIGVGLLINKIVEPYFDNMDEEMALAFSIYCGVCIVQAVAYQKTLEAYTRNALATQLVMYHMKIGEDEVSRLMTCTAYHGHPHMTSLHFNPRALPLRELPCYALKILTDLGFDTKFDIKRQKLARFILYVKRGYRDVAYHNWMHAFNVAQWAYASIVNFKLCTQEYFTDLQAFMYVIACFLHDIDHRGTTASFQVHGRWSSIGGGDLSRPALVQSIVRSEMEWDAVASFGEAVMLANEGGGGTGEGENPTSRPLRKTPRARGPRGGTRPTRGPVDDTNLAALYASEGSVMERHHLAQAMCVLTTEGCDILESLPRRDYDRAIMMLRDNILATDLSNYFKNKLSYQMIALDYQKENKVHFSALQNLLMNAADLSDNVKDWGCVKKASSAALTEFFKQGELEKQLGVTHTVDRDKCSIPDLQIDFMATTVIPLYELLGEFIPKVAPCTKIVESHIEMWEFSKPVFAQVSVIAGLSVLLSPELDGLIELNKQEAARIEAERIEAELLAAQKALLEEEESD